MQSCSSHAKVVEAGAHTQISHRLYFGQMFCSYLGRRRLHFDLCRDGVQSDKRLGLGFGTNILHLQSDFR